ncbi:MAG TPA: PqqD family protein [Silvibacterium sp.]|nr:PqqD family protein [Silvibacterium sp.]
MSIYIARSTALAARVLDGETMIMSAKDSKLFTLNPMGTLIWQSADGQTPLAEIVERKICPQFEIDKEQALSDAEEFVTSLAGHGVLVVAESPITSAKLPQGDAR